MGIAIEKDWRPVRREFAAWIWYPIRAGVVSRLVAPGLESEHEIDWKVKVGDVLGDPAELPDLAVGIRIWNRDFDRLKRDFDRLARHVPLVLQ